jgi:catechol 2,3-dioxygenase-like lactoylglutathione lyase family enzyme
MPASRMSKPLMDHSCGKGDSFMLQALCAIRVLVCGLALAWPVTLVGSGPTTQSAIQTNSDKAAVQSVESVGMTVSDMERSVDFYSRVLSFSKISDIELDGNDYEHLEAVFGLRIRVVRMQLGSEIIELTEYLASRGRPAPPDSHSNDRWFQHIAIVTSDMDRAYEHLRENGAHYISSDPQTLPAHIGPAAGIRAFYFEDPDRHPLEILQFPPEKGDAKWHRTNGKLFLGIDHTAIAVSDTEASLQFYRDMLGFVIAGESENYGPEQEHLTNVFGARLRITSLRAAGGPGIELLEYLAPTGGRPAPIDERSNDLIHHQTRMITSDIRSLRARLVKGQFTLISPGVVAIPKAELGFHQALLLRDPDGHPMEFVER